MMKQLVVIAFCLCAHWGVSQKGVPIIIDTDIAPDYDDVGALAVLHSLADRGEAKILATISCNVFETTVPTLSLLNTYFKKPEIPIGVTKGDGPNKNCQQKWAEAIFTTAWIRTSRALSTASTTCLPGTTGSSKRASN